MTELGRLLGTALVLLTAIVGCGGSSSSSGTTPIVTPPITPPPAAPTVTLTGVVTDMPIPDAIVTITVDGEQFTASSPTAADGSFEVTISSDDPDALVLCEANDPDGNARFTALLNSFGGIQEEADAGGVADGTNITNVTTAQFLLAQNLATDGSIDDLDELQTLAAQVDPDQLLEVSAAIKVVVDGLAGVSLPEEFADVQALAEAIVDGSSTFVQDLETAMPGLIEQTVQDVLEDESLTTPFEAAALPGALVSEGDEIYVFFAGGTGYYTEEDSSGIETVETIAWAVDAEDRLVVTFAGADGVSETDTFTLINDAGGVLSVSVTYDEVEGDATETATFIHLQFGDAFTTANAVGSYRDLEEDESPTEYHVVLSDGTGYDIDVLTGDRDDFFTWQIGASGELIVTDDGVADNGEEEDSDEVTEVYRLESLTADVINILELEVDPASGAVLFLDVLPLAFSSEIMTGPQQDTANTLLLEGKIYVNRDPLDRRIVTFGTDGALNTIYQTAISQEWSFGEADAEWLIDGDGMLFEFAQAADGTTEVTTRSVVSGLGGDAMVLSAADGTQMTLAAVEPFVASNLTGSWEVFQDGAAANETVIFAANDSGEYLDEGQLDAVFTWQVDGDGILRVVPDFGDGGAPLVDIFYRIVGSGADSFDAMFIAREDGVISDDADPGEAPEVVLEFTLNRQVP